MKPDLISQTLKTYFVEKGKTIKVIQRYLRIHYKLIMDEKVLMKRVQNL
ncbi:hypothetical protein A33Q_1542 [Indibacter alkaliphilus LW1]|uniref:Uncharacterized protein n=1 Tax=Indibacter alkaliphilus (strain CCUG 57479 / KCTC 22604 / LW1) TaxID=1189612 RepID=S2DLF5_INDAL|nr:hypothetical protein [Indibacter alkaliphilus]EOZ98035.1 hypothetical protein A33Q_1542 [Indibacter alkaliphilus LW1]